MIALRRFLPYALLLLAILIVFGSALQAPFHYDDHALFADPVIASPGGWIDVWRPSQSRPLTWFTFWANYQLGGDDASGYHAVNLAIHALASCLLLWLLQRHMPRPAAIIAAFLFAVHPIQTEAVVYIFARSTSLAALFSIASLLAWSHARRWTAVALFAVAMLAKEEAAAVPAVIFLLHWTSGRHRRDWPPIAAMFALSLAAVARVAILTAITPGSGAGVQAGVAPVDYLLTQGAVILRYLRLLAIPTGFSVDPDIPLASMAKGLASWAFLVGLAAIAVRDLGRSRSSLWFLAALSLLLPTSSIFPANDLAADRRLYLPMIGFAAVAGLLLERTRYQVMLPAIVVVLGMLSYARAQVWQSEEALWEDAVRSAPNKVRPRIQLARALPPRAALDQLLEARTIAPNDARVASELGRVYMTLGNPSQALAEFGRAVAADPNDALALNNRGVALEALGLREHAVNDFRHALKLSPCLFDARNNLARLGQHTPLPEDCRFTPEHLRAYGSL